MTITRIAATGSRETPAFVGRGWSFPMGTNTTGGMGTAGGPDRVEQSIYIILATTPGERPMRPEFGCPLIDYTFAPMEPATFGRISAEVEASLRRWEPRIRVENVDVAPDPDQDGVLLISVTYVIRDDYDRRNLVFPFYVIPEHRE